MKYTILIALVNMQVASHVSESAITKEYCVLMLFAHICKAYRVIRSKNALSHLQRKNGCAKSKTMRQKCRQWFSDRYYIIYKGHPDHKFLTRTLISIPMPCCSSYLYHVEWWQGAGQFFVVHLLQHPLLFPVIRKSEILQSIFFTHVSILYIKVWKGTKLT